MSNTWLSYFNLSNPYERKARFLPGILTLLPLLPLSVAYNSVLGSWITSLLSGVGLSAVVAVAISYIASAFGNRLQDKLWPKWPHDAPTNLWLDPNDKTRSLQQKKLWYKAIKTTTSLDIQAAVDKDTQEEINIIINDAVQYLRDCFWKESEATRVHLHNIDYGFARNFTGLRFVWSMFAIGSTIGCWTGYFIKDISLFWCVVSLLITIMVIPLGYVILPSYVRKKAHYYAESFFGALVDLEKKNSLKKD